MSHSPKIPPIKNDDSPMMQQYQRIKREHPDTILFFRMGDFYEMFFEDAKIASPVLEIALTSRNKNKSNPIPMCGIPYHAANGYISKLIRSGKKVAICEQMEDPKATKGLVKREVVRIITPGTVLDDNLLDPKNHHFLASIFLDGQGFGLAALDLTTGLFRVTEFSGEDAEQLLMDEIEKLDPREILIPDSAGNRNGKWGGWLKDQSFAIQTQEDWTFSYSQAYRLLLEHFKTHSLEGFGCEDYKMAISAAGALVQYLHETQKSTLEHINTLSTFHIRNYMLLDPSTIKNMELVQASDGGRRGSLLDLLDLSQTPMGARRIKEWVLKPLVELKAIQERLELVAEFKNNLLLRRDLRTQFKDIYDLERLLGRITLGAGSPRDLTALKASLEVLPRIQELLNTCASPSITKYTDSWDNLESVFELIERMIVDEPPFNIKEGNLIKPGCDEELDRLKTIRREGKTWIATLEADEKKRTGIPLLKIGYNKIYGYYIEITKKNLDRVPAEYIRKQSLVNAERYISPELKERESDILSAEEKIADLEIQIYKMIREKIAAEGARLQHMARTLSEIDAILSFAEVAHQFNYCQPKMSDGQVLRLESGRHPLVERMESGIQFIPNDTYLDCNENQILIITGPNMAGKSTYLRQVALITLMAQIGSFVPADVAQIGWVDRIFSRVGAQDYLSKGQSTFMVEMTETANILNNATSKSLIILDEIGRGTSTFDGLSIAWSIVEYIQGAKHIGCKTLFATHYHELTDLATLLPGIKNFNIQVKEWNDEIIFLRKIAPGGADKSYGIQVARLAGLPEKVLERAREVLFNLENNEFDEVGQPKIGRSVDSPTQENAQQMQLFNEPAQTVYQKLKDIKPDELTPRQALDLLYSLSQLVKASSK